MNDLVLNNMGLAYSIVLKMNNDKFDDDLHQVALVGLIKASRQYDSTKSKFSTYAYTCMKNEILRHWEKQKPHKETLSLDYIYKDSTDMYQKCIMSNLENDLIESITNNITDKKLFELYYEKGLTQSEISDILGVSQSKVWLMLQDLKEEIRLVYREELV